jgi:hypothetical protein
MSILSHLHQLFDAQTWQASLHRLRWTAAEVQEANAPRDARAGGPCSTLARAGCLSSKG